MIYTSLKKTITVSVGKTPNIRGMPLPFVTKKRLVGDGHWVPFSQRPCIQPSNIRKPNCMHINLTNIVVHRVHPTDLCWAVGCVITWWITCSQSGRALSSNHAPISVPTLASTSVCSLHYMHNTDIYRSVSLWPIPVLGRWHVTPQTAPTVDYLYWYLHAQFSYTVVSGTSSINPNIGTADAADAAKLILLVQYLTMLFFIKSLLESVFHWKPHVLVQLKNQQIRKKQWTQKIRTNRLPHSFQRLCCALTASLLSNHHIAISLTTAYVLLFIFSVKPFVAWVLFIPGPFGKKPTGLTSVSVQIPIFDFNIVFVLISVFPVAQGSQISPFALFIIDFDRYL